METSGSAASTSSSTPAMVASASSSTPLEHSSKQGNLSRKRSSSKEPSSPKARSPSPSSSERRYKTARAESPTSSPTSPSTSAAASRASKGKSIANGSPGAGSPGSRRSSRRGSSPSSARDGPGMGGGPSRAKELRSEDENDAELSLINSQSELGGSAGKAEITTPASPSTHGAISGQVSGQAGTESSQRFANMPMADSTGRRYHNQEEVTHDKQESQALRRNPDRFEEEEDYPEGEEEEEAGEGNMSNASNTSFLSLSATISRGAYHQCGTARRVKVYELKGEQWHDRGTGYCAGVYDEHEDAALLVARMEDACQKLLLGAADESAPQDPDRSADDSQEREPYVLVVNENLDSDDLLLRTRVVRDDVYQRQQDTLVVWTEPDGKDMALSFQEAEGCQEVWEFLTEVQKHFLLSARGEGLDMDEGEGMGSGMLGMSGPGMTTDVDLVMSDGAPFALPIPRMDNLAIIDMTLKDAASRSLAAREKVAEWILRDDYLSKLVPVFQDCEDLEQLDELHRLCAIMYTIIMLNDNALAERMLRDDVFLGVVGMLEYDPEFPRLKASYRDYLINTAKFKQVVPIPDETIMAKIHQTFRLQYLKDVILARTLDDSTFAVLNSLIFYHQADIVMFCTTSEPFLSSLFQLFERDRDISDEKKAEAIIFLQQLCAVGKQVQLPSRLALYRTLTEWGLLIVLEYALGRQETRLRNAAAEILTCIIEYDASGVRAHILEQNDKGLSPLLGKLASILHEEQGDLGLKTQITESLRILFDSGPDGSAGGPVLAQTLAAASAQAGGDGNRKDDTERFLNWFYDGEVDHLFAPLRSLKRFKELDSRTGKLELHVATIAQSTLYNHLCELLTFVMIHHSFRSQYWVNSTELGTRVASLLFAREKHLRLAALRFFRACLAKGNQFTNRHFIKIELLSAILVVVEVEASRDNLVTSACLEFFEHVRKESIKPLINHLMEKDGERVRALAQHPVIGHYFEALITQWEKSREAAGSVAAGLSTTLADQSDGSMTRDGTAAYAAENERRLRDLAKRGEDRAAVFDADEENYFQEDDDDDGELDANRAVVQGAAAAPTAGSVSGFGPGLVAYTADAEDDEDEKGKATTESTSAMTARRLEQDTSVTDLDTSDLAEAPVVPSSGGLSANTFAEVPSRTPSLISPSLSSVSASSLGGLSSSASTTSLLETGAKRKKGSGAGAFSEDDDDDDDDMVGRLAKRKSMATDDGPRSVASNDKPSSKHSASSDAASSAGKRMSLQISSSAKEKLKGEKDIDARNGSVPES